MIINFISGPRNISTAMMYAFARHPDIKVVDEPFYAHYLVHTGLEHPGRDEIITSMPANVTKILADINELTKAHEIIFLKNMAHHHEGLEWSYLENMINVFLIRDPKQLIASFAQVIPHPTLLDIGLKHEADVFEYVFERGIHKPIVIDTNDILKNPKEGISNLCQKIGISFDEKMLSWEKGPISEDGIWAPFWYKNVHDSTGFAKQKTSERPLPAHCQALYQEALPYYEKLKNFI